jgi:hypothetical protein
MVPVKPFFIEKIMKIMGWDFEEKWRRSPRFPRMENALWRRCFYSHTIS